MARHPKRGAYPDCRPDWVGKNIGHFLTAIDALVKQGPSLPYETQVLYVSPLKALGNDIQKNLQGPLSEIAEQDPFLPHIRVMVRTGDTSASERASMTRRPPHILVTTPESLYILLTSDGGRRILQTVRTVIIDEIHSLARDKRGSHLALSLERLEALTGGFQRIGLSATQKPLEDVARFLVGTDRECTQIDVGHLRELDIAVEIPRSPLSAICSHEMWEEIYEQITQLIEEHKTTIVFVNTRKMAERLAARLTTRLGEDQVSSHHGSLSKSRRLEAEQKLKEGKLRALVATASLELGIDIGDVDLAIQISSTRSIATFLQRVGRSGHGVGRIPKGRIFPLTLDELVEVAALFRALRKKMLDRTPQPGQPLDILAQQIVASCVPERWAEEDLYDKFVRAWPYRDLSREDLEAWRGLAKPVDLPGLSGPAQEIHEALEKRGAQFPQELARATDLLPGHMEMGLGELISQGLLTCDSFGALRWLLVPPSRRKGTAVTVGRWSLFRRENIPPPPPEFVARQLLKRTGVIFRKTIERERIPVPWRDLVRICRTLEARGEIRGGRFVAGFSGEQFADPEAVSLLRAIRKRGPLSKISVSAADPLNFRGILTPEERVSPLARRKVEVG